MYIKRIYRRIFDLIGSERYFEIFEQIAAIPHASGNCRAICDYCQHFAESLGLRCVRDAADNIIIFKDGTAGRECEAPIILQGHLDMVFERDAIDGVPTENEPLRLCIKGDYLMAEHTTLGGDDGIAVAYALALLESKDASHPPLEVLLTSDEEIGMLGADALDASPLRGRRMINIDSEDEGVLLCGCAGGVLVSSEISLPTVSVSGTMLKLELSGFAGGHSGVEIHRGRRNACIELAKMLAALSGYGIKFALSRLVGGGKDNAIPRSASAEIIVDPALADAAEKCARDFFEELKKACAETDPDACFKISVEKVDSACALNPDDSAALAVLIAEIPDGVLRRDPSLPAGIETSSNLGIMTMTEPGTIRLGALVRSAVNEQKQAAKGRLINHLASMNAVAECSGDYPAWEYLENSPLRDTMTRVFRETCHREPTLEVIHAGLECGILGAKIEGLDCVSIGPEMKDIHTPSERLSLSSCRRTWEYILAVLAEV